MRLQTPFGAIAIAIDGVEVEYIPIKLPIGRSLYHGATARYAIPIHFEPDGKEHNIDCRLVGIPAGIDGWSDSGEDIECMTFDNDEGTIRLSIACQGETWEMGCTTHSFERGYDYDALTLNDGMRFTIMPTTDTSKYEFGVCWKKGSIEDQDSATWFGADPNLFSNYCINPEIGTITYDVLLALFKSGRFVDETKFFFEDDPDEEEHYLGYLPGFDKPYWAGYGDFEDDCEFDTAEELFEAKIYDGKSLKERWDTVALIDIGGIAAEDYYYSVPELRDLFTEGWRTIRSVYDVVLKHLNRNDVYGLLAIGAPSDEYESEARMIANRISCVDTVRTIAGVIADVINHMSSENRSKDDYLGIAEEIKKDLETLNIKTYKYFCTQCGAILDEQEGFTPEATYWICKKCGRQLTGDNF